MPPALPDESAGSRDAPAARQRLLDAGAEYLPRLPWQHPRAPADDATLLRFALERANSAVGTADPDELRAALRLVESARDDLAALEAGLLLVARAEGLTWPDIAEHLGVKSPQAAQQRFQRVSSRAPSGTTDVPS